MFYSEDPDDLENEFLQELQQQWLESQPRFNDSFLVETFPDVINDFDDKISELKWERRILIKEIKERSEPYFSRKDEDINAFFAIWCIKHFLIEKLVKTEKTLFLIERLRKKKSLSKHKEQNGLTDGDIEKARNISIIQIAEIHLEKLRKTGKTYTSLCPFHEDKTPSFTLYPDSNRFYCFGCNATGDVITFIQKFFNYDFKTAIYSLI